jgi:hypothetical protein
VVRPVRPQGEVITEGFRRPYAPPPRIEGLGLRIEGQRQGESYNDAVKRIDKENKRFLLITQIGFGLMIASLVAAFTFKTLEMMN